MADSYSKWVENTVEKEKLLVTSNFSFFHSVFKRFVSQGRQKVSLCGKGLINEIDCVKPQNKYNLFPSYKI